MPRFPVVTPQRNTPLWWSVAQLRAFLNFCLQNAGEFSSSRSAPSGICMAIGSPGARGFGFETLFFAGGEENKRMAHVEQLAEQMAERGADRSSVVIAFGGGIVTDLGGFLAAIFMRGIPVIQIPTTLLAQVDAAVGGKTGANLVAGKNLIGSFPSAARGADRSRRSDHAAGARISRGALRNHQDRRDRERAAVPSLLERSATAVLAQEPAVVDHIIAESVRIKAEVVSADERESGLRRILNFGHTFGHALEAETQYTRFLHGEAVSWGMRAATHLARRSGDAAARAMCVRSWMCSDRYGPIPSLDGHWCGGVAERGW